MKSNYYATVFLCLCSLTFLNAQEEEKGPDPQTAPHPVEQVKLPPGAKTTNVLEENNNAHRSVVTPFGGHVDVDLNEYKPGLSMQNLDASTGTYIIQYDDLGNYFASGIAGSSNVLSDVPGPNMAFFSLGTDLGFTSNNSYSELMRLKENTGALGIGTTAPATNSKLHVVQSVDNPSVNGIIFGQFGGPAASNNDTPGVLGENTVDDYYGIGVKGEGGWRGVVGAVNPTGNNTYTGVRGEVSGGTGINYGVYATGSGSTGANYGVYATASGSGRNYAVYGSGDIKATSQLFIGTSTAQEDAASSYELVVDGEAVMEEVRIKNSTNWPDFVFAEKYPLRSIKEMEQFIAENGHLPDVPSAGEIEEQGGSDLGMMQKVLLQKVEELSLYVIELKKDNDELRQMVEGQKGRKKNRKR